MFEKTVDLNHVVNDFLAKEQARKDKIHSLIAGIERSVEETNAKISVLSDSLVECQMNDDAAGTTKLRNEIREFRFTLTGAEDEIAGYKKQLELSPSREKELEKIRQVALKSYKERIDTAAKIQSEREKVAQQQKELQRKIEQLAHEYEQATKDHETDVLKRILPLIEPRLTEPKYSLSKDSFLRGWMHGQSKEEFFETNMRY